MLSGAALQQHMEQALRLALWPALAIALAALVFTLIGDEA